MPGKFQTIEDFRVTFQGHTADEEIYTNMNRLYSDALPDPDRLFIDPANKNELIANTDLIDAIKTMIAEDLIAPGQTVSLQVRNPNGVTSAPIQITAQ